MTIEHYRLYECKKEKRLIITPEQLIESDTLKQEKGTMAECWLDAKQRLGFELSLTQKWLLEKKGIPLWNEAA